MADLIDRQAAIELMWKHVRTLEAGTAVAWLKELPSMDAQPVRTAAWVGIDDFPHEDWECSACGHLYIGYHEPSKYCPGCGARMDGEQDE